MGSQFREGKWKGGTTTLGYVNNFENGKLEINDQESDTIRLVFEKYLELGTMRALANWLNENGISTRTGARWKDSTIGTIVSRKTYIGIMEMNGESYEDEWLRIIDDELFGHVQELRESRRGFSSKG